jgi:23S rRNA (cytidine2498-2'-O)-methyltransferase
MVHSRTVFSASEAYFPAAKQELLSVFRNARVERLGPDAGGLEAEGVDISDVAQACCRHRIIFVRHLMREVARIPVPDAASDIDRVSEVIIGKAISHNAGPTLSLQVWLSGPSPLTYRPDELWKRVAADLSQQGFTVARGNQDQVLSVCVTRKGIVLGVNRRADALTDWPGGRVALARDAGQISRAEFKLDELFKVLDIELPFGGVALDLGASPGGWTRVLRRRGLTVWAVDPAALDLRIAADPGVHHVPTTAAPFLAGTDQVFDLVVNDMRMTATLSSEVMLKAAERLAPNGLAIMTLKISPHDPLKTIRRALAILERSYEILHVRQLYHNRNEVTVVARAR